MNRIEVESFSDATNAAVIRLPGRQFPGIVLQGDSLKILLDGAKQVEELSRSTSTPELSDAAGSLAELLGQYVQLYEEALKTHKEPLPY